MTTVYLLAHQDDEMGVLQHISDDLAGNRRAVCIFMTDGAFGAATAEARNAESRKALTRLGVPLQDIVFLGSTHAILDGRLVETMDRALDVLMPVLRSIGPIDRSIIPAWEGGHHDHDALHLIGRAAARMLGIECRQYSLYRAGDRPDVVIFGTPRHTHPNDETIEAGWVHRVRYLLVLRHYRSQLWGLARLIPRIARHFVLVGKEHVQAVPTITLPLERPAEVILYERWGFYSFADFARHAQSFVQRHVHDDAPASPANRPFG